MDKEVYIPLHEETIIKIDRKKQSGYSRAASRITGNLSVVIPNDFNGISSLYHMSLLMNNYETESIPQFQSYKLVTEMGIRIVFKFLLLATSNSCNNLF